MTVFRTKRFIRTLFWVLAATWIGLAFASINSPTFDYPTWILLGGLVAGSAISTAEHPTLWGLKRHVAFVSVYGGLRVWAIISDDPKRIAAAAVWTIIIVKSILIAVMASYMLHLRDMRTDGSD